MSLQIWNQYLRFTLRAKSPCITCVQYILGCSAHRGVFSKSGDTMSTSEGYYDACGGYHEYIGRCSIHRGDTMSTSGDIMSTSEDVQYIGGCHDESGGAS